MTRTDDLEAESMQNESDEGSTSSLSDQEETFVFGQLKEETSKATRKREKSRPTQRRKRSDSSDDSVPNRSIFNAGDSVDGDNTKEFFNLDH